MSRSSREVLVPLLLLASVQLVVAQSTAVMSGTVTDASGAVVPNASITIRETATGVERVTTSDSAGNFAAPSLAPGDYSIVITAPGFSRYTVQKVTLEVSSSVAVNAKLAIESAGETIQVESAQAPVETQTITVGQVIDRETV